MAWLWICLLPAAAAPAWALSVEQVVALKQAGVNEETIRTMLDIEMVVTGRGLTGTYVLGTASDGRDTVVYQAFGPLGEERYPLRLDPQRKDRLAAILGATSGGDGDGGAAAQAKSYSLLLVSYRNKASAERRAQILADKGLAVRVAETDLGERGISYRLLWGTFHDRVMAETQGQSLKKRGLVDSFSLAPR